MTQPGQPSGNDPGVEQEQIREGSSVPAEGASDGGHHSAATTAGTAPTGITESLTSTSRTLGPAGLYHADVPVRVMALILDVIILIAIGFVLSLLFGGLETPQGALDSAGGALDVRAFLIVLVLMGAVSLGYFAYAWTASRSTVGMRVLGLRIGDEADGGAIVWRQALIRWLFLGIASLLISLPVYVPSALGLLLGALGLLWLVLLLYTIANSPTNQGLHDRYARTIVVRAPRRAR